MGRFGRIVGKMEFEIKGEPIELTPSVGDNRKLLKIMNGKIDETEKMEKVYDFICEVMFKAYPEEDKEEIRKAVEFNLNDFMREVLIGFGWTTRDKWNSLESDSSKKLMSGA